MKINNSNFRKNKVIYYKLFFIYGTHTLYEQTLTAVVSRHVVGIN